jgi:hypothetical protein
VSFLRSAAPLVSVAHPSLGAPFPQPHRMPAPRVEPAAERVECPVVRGHGAPGEAECCSQELAALVEHALLDDLSRPQQEHLRDPQPERHRGVTQFISPMTAA